MKSKKYTISLILIILPIIAFLVIALPLGWMAVSYLISGSDPMLFGLMFFGSLSLLIAPLPCLLFSVVGTVLAAESFKAGYAPSKILFVLGLIEVVISVLGLIGLVADVIFFILAF